MREQFETAIKSRWPDNRQILLRVNHPGIPADGDYENPIVHHLWWAWQLSRADLMVELPEAYENDADGHWLIRRAEAKQMIEGQGLKVMP